MTLTLTLTFLVIMKTVTGLWLPHLIDENSGEFVHCNSLDKR